MRHLPHLFFFAILSCGIDQPNQPDAALVSSLHDQVGTCDRRWSDLGVPPRICDFACSIRPVELPCVDLTRPCNHIDLPCRASASATSPYYDCTATFDINGHRGCCDYRVLPGGGHDDIPTFFECL